MSLRSIFEERRYSFIRINCRESSAGKGLTVVVDARGTTLSVLNALLETIYTVEVSYTVFIIYIAGTLKTKKFHVIGHGSEMHVHYYAT